MWRCLRQPHTQATGGHTRKRQAHSSVVQSLPSEHVCAPVKLLNFSTAYFRLVRLPSDAGMVPAPSARPLGRAPPPPRSHPTHVHAQQRSNNSRHKPAHARPCPPHAAPPAHYLYLRAARL